MSKAQPKPFFFMPIGITIMDRVTIGGVHYRLSSDRDGEVILETEGEPTRFAHFTLLEFYEQHERGDIKIDQGAHNKHRKKYVANPGLPFRSNSPKKRAKAKFYHELIKAYEDLDRITAGGVPRTVDDLGPHMNELAIRALDVTRRILAGETVTGQRVPSVGHFNKMYKKYRDAGNKVQAIVSGDQGPKKANLVDADSLALWEQAAETYATSEKPTQRDVWETACSLIAKANANREPNKPKLLAPSFKVMRRMINELGAYHVCCGRKGRAKADMKFGLSKGGFGFFRPGERVDIDEKLIDLMILLQYAHVWDTLTDEEKEAVKRIRVWVVVAIDLATRYILAMKFCTAPNSQTTVDVIRMMMEDKRELSEHVGAISSWIGRCRPEMVYTDVGSGLVNDDVADIMVECEIDHTRPEAGQPQARGHVESSFRTHRRIVRHFQGRTFKDIVERGDYDSVAAASLPLDRFEKHYVRAILDVYHNTPHEGLGGETPHNAWVRQTQIHKVRPFIEPDIMRHIFGLQFERTLDGDGLRYLHVSYHSPILAEMLAKHGQIVVPIRVNLADMSSISFQKDGFWYVADNTIDLAPKISSAEWMEVLHMATTKFKESTALTLDVLYIALNELREAGTAAALNNPLGLRVISRESINDFERGLMHKAGFTVQKAAAGAMTPTGPVGRAGAFIGESAIGFDDIVSDTETRLAGEEAKKAGTGRKGAAKSRKTSASRLGNASDIEL
ncbi:integrase-like protein [Rhizobium sp. PP-F2F-G38]|nr:integrase-like protein [Rhizobium sp. PP-F2F-G38]